MASRVLLPIVGGLALSGCLAVSHKEGYAITYGNGRWADGSAVQVRVALFGSENRSNLEEEGVYAYRVYVPMPLPRHGRSTTPVERKKQRLLVICLKLQGTGRDEVTQWRDMGRVNDLVLATKDHDFTLAFLEAGDLEHSRDIRYTAADIRALLDGTLEKAMPDYIAATCKTAEGTLRIYGIRTKGGYLDLDEGDRDILQPVTPAKGHRDELPIRFDAEGTFRMRDGTEEVRRVSIRYARWGYRLHWAFAVE